MVRAVAVLRSVPPAGRDHFLAHGEMVSADLVARALQARGIPAQAVDSIDGMVRRIKAEWPNKATPLVIATGGMAEVIQPHSSELELVDPTLTLKGIRLGYEILTG